MPHISNRQPAAINKDYQKLAAMKNSLLQARNIDDNDAMKQQVQSLTNIIIWLLEHYKK